MSGAVHGGPQLMRLHDCDPTMTDTEVLEFCKKGFLMLEGGRR